MDSPNSHHELIETMLHADALELCGNADEAARLRRDSLAEATEFDINCYAYTLLWRSRIERAIELMEKNAAEHPDSWNAYDSLGDAHAENRDFARALVNYTLAVRMAPSESERERIASRIDELRLRLRELAT